jgi:Beta-lactamase
MNATCKLELCAALSLWHVQTLAADEPQPLTQESITSLADRYFGMAAQAGGTAVIAVVKDGQAVAMKGYGLDKPHTNKPVDPTTTLYRIGSVSKLFTAILTMQLIEKGVIDPNDEPADGHGVGNAHTHPKFAGRFAVTATRETPKRRRTGFFSGATAIRGSIRQGLYSRGPDGRAKRRCEADSGG